MENTMADTYPQSERSTFVTVVAWIFIVLSGFASAIATLQNIMFHFVLSQPGSPPIQVPADPNIPPYAGFMLNNMQLLFLAFLVVSLATFITSIALLRRMNWARLSFIAIMALGVVWNLLGLVLTLTMFKNFPNINGTPNMPDMNIFMNAMIAFNVALAVGLSGLFAWIIKKLVSEQVRAEFT
jgi:hypothetical protein